MAHYYLETDNGLRSVSPFAWLQWYERNEAVQQIIGRELVDGVEVSTVFLGVDETTDGETPLVYETKIFGGRLDGHVQRYPSREAAQAGHRATVAQLQRS